MQHVTEALEDAKLILCREIETVRAWLTTWVGACPVLKASDVSGISLYEFVSFYLFHGRQEFERPLTTMLHNTYMSGDTIQWQPALRTSLSVHIYHLLSGSSSSNAEAAQVTTYARSVPTTKFGTRNAEALSPLRRKGSCAANATEVTPPAPKSSNQAWSRRQPPI